MHKIFPKTQLILLHYNQEAKKQKETQESAKRWRKMIMGIVVVLEKDALFKGVNHNVRVNTISIT